MAQRAARRAKGRLVGVQPEALSKGARAALIGGGERLVGAALLHEEVDVIIVDPGRVGEKGSFESSFLIRSAPTRRWPA